MITKPRRNDNLTWDYKSGQDGLQIGADFKDYKSGQKRLQIGAALGLQIGAEHKSTTNLFST